MSKLTILLLVLTLFITGCQNEELDCGEITACTRELRTVKVEIMDPEGVPVELDRTETSSQFGKTVTTYEGASDDQNGVYLVISDTHKSDLPSEFKIVRFRGWKNGRELVDQQFVINKDCCHIGKLEGPNQIIVLF